MRKALLETHLSIVMSRTNLPTSSARVSLRNTKALRHCRLTVVIRDRIGSALCSWVYPVLDDVLVEFPVALLDESHEPAVGKAPDS